MKNYIPSHPIRKLLRALLPTLFAYQIVMRNTLNTFYYGFIITYIVVLLLLWKIEDKKYIRYYTLKCVELLFYFMPISAIIFSFAFTGSIVAQGGDDIATGFGALGGMIGGSMFVVITIIVGLIGGLILRSSNKKPESAKKEGFVSGTVSYGLLILYVILVSMIWGFSQLSKVDTNAAKNESPTIKTVIGSGESNNENLKTDTEEIKPKQPTLTDHLGLTIDGFRTIKRDYDSAFEFDATLQNNTSQSILGYKGNFQVLDMFGDNLGVFNFEGYGEFGSGDTITKQWSFGANEYLNEHIKLSNSEYENIEYKYTIEKIIFSDEYDTSNKLLGTNKGQDIENIDFQITNKEQLEGRYDFGVAFDVSVTNNTDKTIKGIKGSYAIYNMFEDSLKKYEINVTDPILSGNTYTENMQYTINEYMRSDTEVYSTPFEYLKYNFNIEKVLYEE